MISMSSRQATAPIQVRPQPLRVPFWVLVMVVPWVVFARAVRWLVRTPLVMIGLLHLAGLVAVGLSWGETAAVAVGTASLVVLTAGLALWNRLHSASFHAYAVAWVLGHFRKMTRYRRGRWLDAMDVLGLVRIRKDETLAPTILKVRSSLAVDRIRVRLLRHQKLSDLGSVTDRLAQYFEAEQVRISSVYRSKKRRKLVVDVVIVHRDLLSAAVPPIDHDIFDRSDQVDFKALPVALDENGLVWKLRLWGNHILIAGATGAGKGSVLWSIIKALLPAVRSGRVQLHAIDPKVIELSLAKGLFSTIVDGLNADSTADAYIEFLERMMTVMRTRLARMQGHSRDLEVTSSEPLHVIVIDELAAVTAYVTDSKKAAQINGLLSEILTQGRAAGVLVVGALQDPRKEVLKQRGLFTMRIALRLNEAADVSMVLSQGAYDRGAKCDEIAQDCQGTAFVLVEGQPEALRMRYPFVDDDEVREFAERWAPSPNTAAEVYPFPTSDAA